MEEEEEKEEEEVKWERLGGAYGHSTNRRFVNSRRSLVRCLFLFIRNRHITKKTPIEEGSLVTCLYHSSMTTFSQD